MIKYQKKITDISLVNDTISTYQKNRYLKCRYDTDISTIFSIYRPTFTAHLLSTLTTTKTDFQQKYKENVQHRKILNKQNMEAIVKFVH